MTEHFFSIGSTPQGLPATATTADTMEEVVLSPTASGAEQDTGFANVAPRCV
jgi:hypothetical protein